MSRSRRVRAAQTYRLTLLIFASLAALLAVFVLAIYEHGAVGQTVRAALRDPSMLNSEQTRVAQELLVIPAAVAILTYIVASQAIQLLRIWLYLRALHRASGDRLRLTAPLYRLGHLERRADLPLATPLDHRGRPSGSATPLTQAIAGHGHALLFGVAGGGKTTAILGLVYEASRARALIPLWLGRRPLPALISIPAYAGAARGAYDTPDIDLLEAAIAIYASPGLAARTARLLRRRKAILYCDDLDEAPESALGRTLGQFARLGTPPYRRVSVVMTANMAARARLDAQFGDQKVWRPFRLTAPASITSDSVSSVLRARGARSAGAVADLLRAHLLDAPDRAPVTQTALTALDPDASVPVGLPRLLAAQVRRQCDRAANERISGAQALQFLAGVASALCEQGDHAIPLPATLSPGAAIGAWLETRRPRAPTQRRTSAAIGIGLEEIEALCAVAMMAGLLVAAPDGSALRFSHRLIEAVFAALWMLDHDDPSLPLEPRLLGEQWTLPLLFWAGLCDRPERVAEGLLDLRGMSTSVAARAGLKRQTSAQPTAMALAVAASMIGSAAQLAALVQLSTPSERATTHVETRLRAVLDEALAACAEPMQAEGLADAARRVWELAGPEIDTAAHYLIDAPSFGRLTRAELLTSLGLIASPAALDVLIARLGEREPTLRAGVTRGLTLAGYVALPALQARLGGSDEWMRQRAREIIDAIVATDEEGDTSAHRVAVHALATGAPDERAAAAETLGALQAHPAVDPLIARLRDSDTEVRVAAARALGRLADPNAIAPLRSALRHADVEARVAITEALGAYQSPELAPDLARLLSDPAPSVRAAAATALSRIGAETAVEALRAHGADPDPAAQAAILSALRRLGH